MISSNSYSDLNISADAKDLKNVVLRALSYGYQTIAINTKFIPGEVKGKKKGTKKKPISIPEPTTINLTAQDLKQYKIEKEFVILSRITICYSELEGGFVHKLKADSGKYDLIAFSPSTLEALRQTVLSDICVDLISFDLDWSNEEIPSELLVDAVRNYTYFEFQYSPCIGSFQSDTRRRSFSFGRSLSPHPHRTVVSSGAASVADLRCPKDALTLAHWVLGVRSHAPSKMSPVVSAAGELIKRVRNNKSC